VSDIVLEPVFHEGEFQDLWDIRVDGEWCGSRRTIAACCKFLNLPEKVTVRGCPDEILRILVSGELQGEY